MSLKICRVSSPDTGVPSTWGGFGGFWTNPKVFSLRKHQGQYCWRACCERVTILYYHSSSLKLYFLAFYASRKDIPCTKLKEWYLSDLSGSLGWYIITKLNKYQQFYSMSSLSWVMAGPQMKCSVGWFLLSVQKCFKLQKSLLLYSYPRYQVGREEKVVIYVLNKH